MTIRKLSCAAILTTAFAAAPAIAQAALLVNATDNNVPLTFTASVNTPGNLVGTFADTNFAQISVDIIGVPNVPSPEFTVTVQVSGSTGGGHTIGLTAVQDGLMQPAGFDGQLIQSFDNLTGAPGPAVEGFRDQRSCGQRPHLPWGRHPNFPRQQPADDHGR